ncbi:unnamed protein product, partial [Didymodactylos carnosus]
VSDRQCCSGRIVCVPLQTCRTKLPYLTNLSTPPGSVHSKIASETPAFGIAVAEVDGNEDKSSDS